MSSGRAFRYKRIAASGDAVVSISKDVCLHAIIINRQSTAAVSTSQVTVYANSTASGSSTVAIISLNNPSSPDFIYDVICENGISVTVDAAASPIDFTVAFS